MADNISAMPDAAFLTMLDQVRTVLGANPANYPCIPTSLQTDLDDFRDDFSGKLTSHVSLQAAALAGTTGKDTSRDGGEPKIRMVRNLCNAAKLDQALIDALGIPKGSTAAPS